MSVLSVLLSSIEVFICNDFNLVMPKIISYRGGPDLLSGKVLGLLSKNPRFELHWILLVFLWSVLGQDTSEPQPSTGETQERHE